MSSDVSLPGLTRQSIIHEQSCCEDGWIRGSSPRMTKLRSTCPKRLPLFFMLSKTLGIMLLPTNFLIGIGLRRRRSAGDALCHRSAASFVITRRVAARAMRAFRRSGTCCFIRWSSAFRRGMPRAARLMASSCSADRSMPDLSAAHGTPVVRSCGRPHHCGRGAGARDIRTRASSFPAAART